MVKWSQSDVSMEKKKSQRSVIDIISLLRTKVVKFSMPFAHLGIYMLPPSLTYTLVPSLS